MVARSFAKVLQSGVPNLRDPIAAQVFHNDYKRAMKLRRMVRRKIMKSPTKPEDYSGDTWFAKTPSRSLPPFLLEDFYLSCSPGQYRRYKIPSEVPTESNLHTWYTYMMDIDQKYKQKKDDKHNENSDELSPISDMRERKDNQNPGQNAKENDQDITEDDDKDIDEDIDEDDSDSDGEDEDEDEKEGEDNDEDGDEDKDDDDDDEEDEDEDDDEDADEDADENDDDDDDTDDDGDENSQNDDE
jgi:hypothetical protein